MRPWLRLTFAFVVFAHAFIYIHIGSRLPAAIAVWRGRSWLLGDAVIGAPLAALALATHVIAGALLVCCAAAIGLAPWLPGGWWPGVPIAGAAVGLAAFAVFWDGHAFVEEGGIGAVVSAILLLAAALFPATFR